MKKYIKQVKKRKWWLVTGLLIIPVTFIFILFLIRIAITIAKTSQFHINLKQAWFNVVTVNYSYLIAATISISLYLLYGFKLCKITKTEARIKTTDKTDFGKAKWLTKKEINNKFPIIRYQKITKHHGFIINAKQDKKIITFNVHSNTHNLIIGGTRSGKTQGIVLPTIQINSQSTIKPTMIITDPKGELYNLQRNNLEQQGYDVKVINLRDLENSMCWNPLQQIYNLHQKMLFSSNEQEKLLLQVQIQTDIQDLARTLFPKSYHEKQPFWRDSGCNVIQAIILGILEDLETKLKQNPNLTIQEKQEIINKILPINKFNLASVTIIATMKKDLIQWFKQRQDTSIAKITASNLTEGEADTIGNIMMTIATQLNIFKNSFIQNLTSRNDLHFTDLINKPTALFIVIPDENDNYYVIASLLISQIYKFLIAEASKNKNNKLSKPVYFLCDEFANIPAIPHMERIISAGAGRNIYFQLIVQDIQQIYANYGERVGKIIFANCFLQTFLQTMEVETAERYAKMLGEQTVEQISTSGKGVNKNQSTTLKAHSLITVADLMQLPQNQAIIFLSKENPAKTKLVPWWTINTPILKDNNTIKTLELIDFEKNYYYNIKKTIKTSPNLITINSEVKSSIPKSNDNIKVINSRKELSKEEIKLKIEQLRTEFKKYESDNSINGQEIKLAINKQIERLKKKIV